MKKVRMNISIVSSEDWSYYPGQEVELSDSLAKKWAKAGHCTIISEGTTTDSSETATTTEVPINTTNESGEVNADIS